MDRSTPFLTRLSALLALLIAALAAGPIDSAAAARPAAAARSLLADLAAPLPDRGLVESGGQTDEKRSAGGGAPPTLPGSQVPAAPSGEGVADPAPSSGRLQSSTASYRARAPPAE
jgi:hypothetical protein